MRQKTMIAGVITTSLIVSGCGAAANLAGEVQNSLQEQVEEQTNQLVEESLNNILEQLPTPTASPSEPELINTPESAVSSYIREDSAYEVSYNENLNGYSVQGEGYLAWVENECIADIVFEVSAPQISFEGSPDSSSNINDTSIVRFVKNSSTPAYISNNDGETWYDSRSIQAPPLTLSTPTTLTPNSNINEQGLCSLPLWDTLLEPDSTDPNMLTWKVKETNEFINSRSLAWANQLLPGIAVDNPEFLGDLESLGLNGESLNSLLQDLLPETSGGDVLPNDMSAIVLDIFNPVVLETDGGRETFSLGSGSGTNGGASVVIDLLPTPARIVEVPADDTIVGKYEFSDPASLFGLPALEDLQDLSTLENFDVNSLLEVFGGGSVDDQALQELLQGLIEGTSVPESVLPQQ